MLGPVTHLSNTCLVETLKVAATAPRERKHGSTTVSTRGRAIMNPRQPLSKQPAEV